MFFSNMQVDLPMTATSTGGTNDMFSASAFVAASENNSNAATEAPPAAKKPVKSSTDKTKTLLPVDFQPSEYSVICGNKRTYFNSVGNRRFRVICKMHAKEFMNAQSKHEKSFVVSTVMKTLRDACPVGAFVAFENGRWWECSERTSREKVGTFFRDLCGSAYKSSSKNKIAQRRIKRSQYSDLSEDSKPSSAAVAPLPQAALSRPATVSRASSAPASSTTTTTSLQSLFAPSSYATSSSSMNNTSRTVPLSSLEHIMRAQSFTAPSLLPSVIAQLEAEDLAFPTPLQAFPATPLQTFASLPLLEEENTNSNEAADDDHSTSSSSGGSFFDVDDLTPCAL